MNDALLAATRVGVLGVLLGLAPASWCGSAIDLQSLAAVALEKSPVVLDRAKALEAAEGALVSARYLLPANPELTFGYTTDRFAAEQGEEEEALELAQEIEPWGQRQRRIASAQALYDAAQHDLDAARLAVVLGVRRGYLRLLVQNDKLRLLDDIRTLGRSVEGAAQSKLNAGLISDVGYQIVAFESVALDNDYEAVRAARDAELVDLRSLAGVPQLEPLQFAGLPGLARFEADAATLVQQALDRRPDLLALRKEIESRDADLALLRRERLPALRLSLGYRTDRSVVSGEDVRYVPGAMASIAGIDDDDELVTIGATISLPLFRRNQGELLTTAAEAGRLVVGLEAAEQRLAADVGRHLTAIHGKAAILERMREALPELNAALEDVTRAFTLGEYSVDRYLVEKDRLLRARLSYDDVLLDYLETIMELELTVGATLYEPELPAGEGSS